MPTRLPDIGFDVPQWLQQWLVEAGEVIRSLESASTTTGSTSPSGIITLATLSARVAAAILTLPTEGGIIDLSTYTGSQTWNTTVVIDRPVTLILGEMSLTSSVTMFSFTGTGNLKLRGTSRFATKIFAASGFLGNLISINTVGPFSSVEDLWIFMSNAPTQNAIELRGAVYNPLISNVVVSYPASTGTGTAILLNNTAGASLRHIYLQSPGIGIDINGDTGSEHHFTDIQVENPQFGVRLRRTTATDFGGVYFHDVKVYNPGNRANSRGFLFTSTVANSAPPIIMVDCVGDGALGGPTLEITNINTVSAMSCWFQNAAASGNNYSAVKLTNTTNCRFVACPNISSNSRVFEFFGTLNSILITNNTLSGVTEYYFDAASTTTWVRAPQNFALNTTNDSSKISFGDQTMSVQHGTVTIANSATTGTATVTSVDTTKSWLIRRGYTNPSGGTSDLENVIALTNATTVTGTRVGTVGVLTIGFDLVTQD